MRVLSLFDGISGGQVALARAGVPVTSYMASEIDKYAIKITQNNFPSTIQLGSVTDIQAEHLGRIDLLIGGSPCQGFSIAGKQLNFNDERSKLFFEYVRLLKELKPKYFLLENVMMKQEYQDIISERLSVQPIMINSGLVSAQNRKRLYWTNIPNVSQPEDKNLCVWDILEDKGYPAIKSHGEYVLRPEKAMCIDANYWKGADNHGQRTIIIGCNELGKANLNGHDFLKRVYDIWGKSPTLTAICGGNQERKIAINSSEWRKLTPTECEALQTYPVGYTEGISNTQRYKALGNSFTVDVIAHILKNMKIENGK